MLKPTLITNSYILYPGKKSFEYRYNVKGDYNLEGGVKCLHIYITGHKRSRNCILG